MAVQLLFGSDAVKEGPYKGVQYIRNPQGDRRRQGSRIDKHLAEPHEENIRETQRNADSYVHADASPPLL